MNNTAATSEVLIPILSISRDPTFQVRKQLDSATVKRYMAVYSSEKPMPPVRIAQVGGALILIDGWHRIAALESLSRGTVMAIIAQMTRDEALWEAAAANLEHGKPLTPAENKAVYKTYVKTKKHLKKSGSLKSLRQIGLELGKPFATVRNWERQLFPSVAAQRGGGMEYAGAPPEPHSHPPHDPNGHRDALSRIRACFVASSDPKRRGEIVESLADLLHDLKSDGNWETLLGNPLITQAGP